MMEFTSVEQLILNILSVLLIVILVGSIYAFVRWIFSYIFSDWEEESKKKAINWIRFMIIWIVLTIGLLFFFEYILRFIWISTYENFSGQNIFNNSRDLLENLINAWGNYANDKYNWWSNSDPSNVNISNYEL